ncbi:MAG: hypothetical protein AMXMBFR83_19220 [Phycisphaerae bacterium]
MTADTETSHMSDNRDPQRLQTIEVLNRLHAAERRSLLPRLPETAAFVSWSSAAELEMVEKMVAEEGEHLAWLSEALDEAGGALYPAGPDIHTGHLHYLDLRVIMPEVIRSLEGLVRAYQDAAKVPMTPRAAEVVNRILRRHQAHLERLRALETRAPAGA